jgi:prenyltransferase beta subunit
MRGLYVGNSCLARYIVATLLLFSGNSYGDIGVDWLSGQSNADGSISLSADISTSYQSTVEVIRTFSALGLKDNTSLPAALQYVDEETYHNTEYLSQKIISNVEYARDVADLITELKYTQNADGGFGDFKGYDSSSINTAYAAEAFAAVGQTSLPEAKAAVTFLMSNQNADGSWSVKFNNPSVYITAQTSIALQKYLFNMDVNNALSSASSFLINQQTVENNWGSDWETAYALLALVPIELDTDLYIAAIEDLRSKQLVVLPTNSRHG